MTDTPNRPFWQIHLSTFMVLLLVIAIIWGANVLLFSDMIDAFGSAGIEKAVLDPYFALALVTEICLVLFVVIVFELDARRGSRR